MSSPKVSVGEDPDCGAIVRPAGILHRDVKLANLLVTKSGLVKLSIADAIRSHEPRAVRGAAPAVVPSVAVLPFADMSPQK